MKIKLLANLKGDILGGASSAMVALPQNIVFGLIAFAPLGNEFVAQGILAGFYSALFVGLFAALFGGTPGLISGPKAASTLVLNSLIAHLIISENLHVNQSEQILYILTLAFFVVFISGVFQLMFGALRLGNLVKFVSYPVIAGFLNGTAILIILGNIWNFMGTSQRSSLLEILAVLSEIKLLNIFVGIVVVITMLYSRKITKKIHGAIVGLAFGFAFYYLFILFGLEDHLGGVFGTVSIDFPGLDYLRTLPVIFQSHSLSELAQIVLPSAIAIAALGSIDTLLTTMSTQHFTNVRSDADQELVGQGLGNMAAACFGGIAGAGFLDTSLINHQAGGRTKLSGVFYSLTILILMVLFSPVIAATPHVAVAGIAFGIAFQLIDPWSLKLLKNLISHHYARRREPIRNLLIVLVVMFTTVFFNLIVAVGLGIALSFFIFISQMSKSLIRKVYRGNKVHSKKQRDLRLMETLSEFGDRIAIIELEGAIFFGSSENLVSEIDRLIDDEVAYIILDMKRVSNIDATGAMILGQINERLKRQNKLLAMSYLRKGGVYAESLRDIPMMNGLIDEYEFTDTNEALEYFEDRLLFQDLAEVNKRRETELKDFAVLKGLNPDELNILAKHLTQELFSENETIFAEGDKGDALFFLVSGSAVVKLNLADGRMKNLLTFSNGTIFGEMALLDGKPRSANVEAKEALVCYKLSLSDFESLSKEHPHICFTFLINLARMITERVRLSDKIISELEA